MDCHARDHAAERRITEDERAGCSVILGGIIAALHEVDGFLPSAIPAGTVATWSAAFLGMVVTCSRRGSLRRELPRPAAALRQLVLDRDGPAGRSTDSRLIHFDLLGRETSWSRQGRSPG